MSTPWYRNFATPVCTALTVLYAPKAAKVLVLHSYATQCQDLTRRSVRGDAVHDPRARKRQLLKMCVEKSLWYPVSIPDHDPRPAEKRPSQLKQQQAA